MDRYCGSTFWDVNITWNTANPDFTPCFENTVLLWSACVLLWIPAIFDVYTRANLNGSASSSRSYNILRNSGWTWLGLIKMINVIVLICLQVTMLCVNLYEQIGDANIPVMVWLTPLLLIATHFLSGCLIIFHKNRRIHTSGYHLIHWLSLSIVLALMCRTKFIQYQNDLVDRTTVALLGTAVFLMFLQSFLLCWSDIAETVRGGYTRFIECDDDVTGIECPGLRSSCLSNILFSWCTPLVLKGYKTSFKADEMWDLIPFIRSKFVRRVFNRHYGQPNFGEIRSTYRNIIKPMWRTCGTAYYKAMIYGTVNNIIVFFAPQLMGLMIDFVNDSTVELWKGYLWAFCLLLLNVLTAVLLEQFYMNVFKCSLNVKTGLILAIYQKSLRVSHEARKDKTTGEIVNLMSVDADKIQWLNWQLNTLWAAPIQILVGVILLWRELGVAFLPGIGILCSILPINWVLSTVSAKYQRARMTKKDERIKVISEVLSGMQVIKLYAWEPSFRTQIQEVRSEEMQLLRKRMFIACSTEFIHNSIPFLVSVAAFFTYTYMSGDVLSPKKAFTVVTLFNILTPPITDIPASISAIVDVVVSFKRVNDFLNADEVNPQAKKVQPASAAHEFSAIEIIDGNFAWQDLSICSWKLSDINLEIKSGKLTAIVGSVASGKSSLLSAIIGDMKHSGEVIVRGRIAYAPQVPWILNASLRENILFGRSYNKDMYDKIIDSCRLGPDIEMLPGGDLTEIGEKGINLSGGQKQRVSLARLAYSGADILLLDDVLSAVDSHVAKCIFNDLLGPNGLLAGKTRVLCSHAYNFLSQVDHIIVMKNGKIEESTNYQEIKQSGSRFSKLLSDLEQTSSKCESKDDDKETERQKIHYSKAEDNNKAAGMLIEEERLQTGYVKAPVYVEFIRAMGTLVVGSVLLFFCSEGLGIFRNIVLLEWTESGRNASDTMLQHNYAVEYAIVGIIQSLCYLFGYVFLAIGILRAVTAIHNNMLHRILRAPMSFFNVTPLGRIVNRFSSDVETLDVNLQYQMGDWICHIFKIFAILITLSYANKFFLVFIVPLLGIYYILQRYYIVCMNQLQRLMNAHLSPIYSHFQETLSGTSTVRAYEAQERLTEGLADKIDCYNRALYPHIIVRRWLSIRLGFLGSLIVFAPALFAVIWRQTADGALVALTISYALQVTDILSWLVKVTSYLQNSFVSAERVLEYSKVQQEADFDTKGDVDQNNSVLRHSWPEKGIIVFNNYETRYRPGLDLVLKQFSCEINSGEKIGIVGRTGAGKSSLTLGLFRIIEGVSGDIIIDGVNIAHIGLHDLRRRITVIPQDPVLFSRSLRMNLDPFEEHDDDKLWQALTLAHLKPYVEEQPEGLQFRIAEGGENLSVGQRQLVCLARAILRKSSILVLDEATASVDSVTDALIQQTVREHFVGCTLLNVAHRLKTVLDSSRIMVLNRGEIVEFDNPVTLLANPNSYFYGMAKDAGLV